MSASKYVLGTLIGGLLGAAIGLLLAPRSGVETREMVKDALSSCCEETRTKLQHEVGDKTEVLKSKAASIGNRVKELSEEIETRGREALSQGLGTLEKAVATKPAATESSSDN